MLTVFTVADRRYEPFVVPYAASVLSHNPGAVVEIVVEQPRRFQAENGDALDLLDAAFPGGLVLTRGRFEGKPHSLRFLLTPTVQNDYVYIGDIDVLVLTDIAVPHLAQMDTTGLPYSNMVRVGQERLTGLHFTRWDAFYPLTTIDDQPKLKAMDEHYLYQVILKRGLNLPPGEFRPMLGYHLTPSRSPHPIYWAETSDPAYVATYMALRDGPLWIELWPLLDMRYRRQIGLLEALLTGLHTDAFIPSPRSLPRLHWD